MDIRRSNNNVILIILCIIIILMAGGYASFSQLLTINGTANISNSWCVGFDNTKTNAYTAETGISGGKEPTGLITFDGNTCGSNYQPHAVLTTDFTQPGDEIIYTLTIKNKSTVSAAIKSIDIDGESVTKNTVKTKGNIVYKINMPESTNLSPEEETTMTIKVTFQDETAIDTGYKGESNTLDVKVNVEQGANGFTPVDGSYTVTYNNTENGGTENQTANIDYYDNVDLSKTGVKEGWTFVGWNTDKNAHEGLAKYKMPEKDAVLYAIFKKDITITYEKEGNEIESISKNKDSFTIYNNEEFPKVKLPTVKMKNNNYGLRGWFIEDVFIGNSGEKYTFNESATVKAIERPLPVMRSYSSFVSSNNWLDNTPDFHKTGIRETITEIEFIDLDNTTLTVPTEINNVSVWDVSEEQNESVIAWLDGTKIYIGGKGGVIGNKDSAYLFNYFTNVTSIKFNNNFDTRNVESMEKMFNYCQNVTSLDLRSFDTSNVTSMRSMFQHCEKATSIDVSNFNTSNVTLMNNMFSYCQGLTVIDLKNFDTSSVTNMSGMFQRCEKATTIDVSSFDTSNVTLMNHMFNYCQNVKSLDLSNFDTSNVTAMNTMFQRCEKATTIDVSSFDTSNVETMSSMFNNCFNLNSLNLSNFNTSNVVDMQYMFQNCRKISELDLTSFNTRNVTNMVQMFNGSSILKTIYVLDTFTVSNVTSSTNMFDGCNSLVGGNGTAYSTSYRDKTRALIDEDGQVGYFTDGGFLKEAIINFSTTSNSITATVSFAEQVNVSKYEFKINDGDWIDNGTNNTYRFENLAKNTKYLITIRYTKDGEVITPESERGKTDEIETPLITSKFNTMTSGEVTIEYPEGCGSTFTCNYAKNDEATVNVTNSSVTISFNEDSEYTAYVTDGLNEVSTSYTVVKPTKSFDDNGLNIPIVSYGDGLYEEDDRYVFRGANPNNYIKLNNETYRIMSIEDDGAIKVIKNDVMSEIVFDKGGTSNNRYSSSANDYCHSTDGCNAWGSKTTTLNENGEHLTALPANASDLTVLYNLPDDEAYLNVWLNGGTYAGENIAGWYDKLPQNLKNYIVSHMFDISYFNTKNIGYTIKWNGKIGIMSAIDFIAINSNQELCNSIQNNSNLNISIAQKCKKTNWLNNSEEIILSKIGNHNNIYDINYVYTINDKRISIAGQYASKPKNFRPVFHLSSDITLTGSGIESNMYSIE